MIVNAEWWSTMLKYGYITMVNDGSLWLTMVNDGYQWLTMINDG